MLKLSTIAVSTAALLITVSLLQSSHAHEFSTRAEWGDYPFLVTFKINKNSCAGSIISTNWVLTSSSCLIDPNDSDYFEDSEYELQAGRVNDYTNHKYNIETPFTKRRVFTHEKFNPTTYEHNIGLIYFPDGFNYSRYLNSISTEKMAMPAAGQFVGWGDWDGDFSTHSGIKYSDVNIVGSATCTSHLANYNCSFPNEDEVFDKSTEGVYCTIFGGPIATMGYTNFAGGPLIMKHSESMLMQVGIVSWTADLGLDVTIGPCTKKSAILVYTDLSQYTDWINDIRSRNSAGLCGLSAMLIAFSITATFLFN